MNKMVYVLMVIVWATAMQQAAATDCGPLKTRSSEYDACYNATFNAELPCPALSDAGTRIVKKCRAPYLIDTVLQRPVLNVTYFCQGGRGWISLTNKCQSDCGQPRADNKYPWLVAIYDEDENLKCAGTIISLYHILTAATCFGLVREFANGTYKTYAKDVSNYTIVAGKHYSNFHRKSKSAQIRKIKKATTETISQKHVRNILLLEVDSEFDFFNDVQPICIDWNNYYELKDFSEGNEAVAVNWDYNKDQMVPCEVPNEFNLQFWHTSTCEENSGRKFTTVSDKFCGTYTNGNHSSCGESMGAGVYFKSSPWRYYLRGITSDIIRGPEVTHGLHTTVSLFLGWLKTEMQENLALEVDQVYRTKDAHLSKSKIGCKLPEHIKYGMFKLVYGEAYRSRAWVSAGTRIVLICSAAGDETPITTRCNLGEWQPSIDKLECKRPGTCPALSSSESEDVLCKLNGQNVGCAEPENNTIAFIRCKPFHVILGNQPIYKCKDGEWDPPYTGCTLECGTKRVGVATLVVGGSEVIQNEYPWVAAIYRSEKQICGGTIISKSYVLSAAHCFTKSQGVVREKELFTIFAGKHYRNFTREEASAQSRKIKSLHIHDDYKGNLQKYRDDIALIELDVELTPTLEVQPACVDWDNIYEDFDFRDGNNAVVTGWGYTEQSGPESEVLKKLVVSYRQKDVCMANLPPDFSHQFVSTDKICAGDKDNNMNVCEGDSGGGLYFQSEGNRFYVRGIVSLTARTETGTCHVNKYALYTKVSKYLLWMETITRRVL